ncbi:MAG: hypothetical protein ABR505_10955 [Actinomycetota bacterium]
MIEVMLVALAAAAGAVYVARPLLRAAGPDLETSSPTREAELRRDAALAGLDDLEFDRDAGKLSDDDFAQLRSVYESEAASAIDELDRLARTTERNDLSLEAEIAAVRRALRCPNCGAPRKSGEPCGRCGT